MPEFNTHGQLFVYKIFPYTLPVSHNTSITHRQTDRQTNNRWTTTTTIAQLLLKYDRLKTNGISRSLHQTANKCLFLL